MRRADARRAACCGAISTGRPLSNSTACNASDDDTSSPASGCGTMVRSARRACWATRSSSRPVMLAKLAVGPVAPVAALLGDGDALAASHRNVRTSMRTALGAVGALLLGGLTSSPRSWHPTGPRRPTAPRRGCQTRTCRASDMGVPDAARRSCAVTEGGLPGGGAGQREQQLADGHGRRRPAVFGDVDFRLALIFAAWFDRKIYGMIPSNARHRCNGTAVRRRLRACQSPGAGSRPGCGAQHRQASLRPTRRRFGRRPGASSTCQRRLQPEAGERLAGLWPPRAASQRRAAP